MRLERLGPSVLLALGLLAYRRLFLNAFRLPTRWDVELWFFTPDKETALFVIGIAGWLLWRRRARLLSLPVRSDRGTTLVLLAIGTGLFLWAQLTRANDLLLPSLASNLLALASANRGRAGCRVVLLPALVLLLAVPIPAPIRSELAWQLQLLSARGATWLVQTAGYDATLGGVLIRSGERTFTVIESCSGLRGMVILTLVAVVVRELFAASGRRQWLLVLAAPFLGLALNILRIAVVVAASTDLQAPGPAGDHTPQGVAVLIAGTGALYALGWWLAGPRGRRSQREALPGSGFDRATPGLRWRAAAACLAVLVAVSVGVTPFSADATPRPSAIEIPENRSGWSGEDLLPDQQFVGYLPSASFLYRRYEKKRLNGSSQVVDLFVHFEFPGYRPSSGLFTSKIAMPGSDWSVDEARRAQVWSLGVDGGLALASRDSQQAFVYSWRVRDGGIWRETLRSALALESGPFSRERPRAVVRLVTPLRNDGPVARDRAKKTLNRFIRDFRDDLAGL